MFFKKRKTPAPPSTPNWVMWIVVGFVAFALINNQFKGSQVNKTLQQASENLAPSKLLPLDSYKKIFAYDDYLRMKELAEGTGTPVICGQQVKIAYKAGLEDGTLLADNATGEKPLTFRAGLSETMPALSRGVNGMKKGGKRGIVSPPGMAYGAPGYTRDDAPADASAIFEIDLLDVSPKLPDIDASPYRIANVTTGVGPTIACGDEVKIHLTLWSVDGRKLFSTLNKEPLTFTPGRSEVAIGLEQGVLGMTPRAVRTLVIPPAFQKTMNGNAPKISLPLPSQQTVLMDVEYVL